MSKPPAPSTSKAMTSNEFLTCQPENLRDFYAAIFSGLPPLFQLSEAGIGHKGGAEWQRSTPFCTPFRVKARVEDPKTQNWVRVVELLNARGVLVDCVIPEGHLTGKQRDAISALSNRGLGVHDQYQISTILDLVRNWPVSPEAHLASIDRVGWVPDRDAFVLTSGRLIAQKGVSPRYRFGVDHSGKEIGTLTQWRDHIAALAVGNPNMLFGISLGFSTALLDFTELDTLIYHFYAQTSIGKTRLLRTASTVWPSSGVREKTWAGTINGLEGEIAASHSILMALDELRGDATPDLPALIYRFANGSEKARGRKEGGSKLRSSWRTAVISTGEHSFVEIVRKLGTPPTGGQGVRMLDIPAIGQHGVFDALHGSETSADFLDRLDKAIRKASGPAGSEFVQRLLEIGEEALTEALETDMRRHALALQRHLGVSPGDKRTGEIQRVIKSFALVATAGEWASTWGLTGWEAGLASDAVLTIAARWLAGRGRLPFEHSENLKKIREYLVTNEQLFVFVSEARRSVVDKDRVGPGFRDETFFYLLPAALSNLSSELGTTTNKLVDALIEGGFLVKGGEDKSLQFRLSSSVPGRPRVYRLQRTILNFEGDPEVPSHQPKDGTGVTR